MTLTTTASRVNYPGTGSTGPFTIPFRFTTVSDLVVTKRSSVGVETTLTNVTHYSVTGAGNATGALTLVTALAVGETISIRRRPSNAQSTDLANQGSYFGSTHEGAFDRITMLVQALQDQLDRSFGVSESWDPSSLTLRTKPETGKALVWQSSTELGNSSLDASAVALPGGGRTVETLTAYLLNNAVWNAWDFDDDGVLGADDIQAAIDAAEATPRPVVIPGPGPHTIDTPLTITSPIQFIGLGNGVRLRGDGLAADEYILDVGVEDPDGIEGLLIANFAFEQNGAGPWTNSLVRLRNVAGSCLRDIKIKEGLNGLHIVGARSFSNTYINITCNGSGDSRIAEAAVRFEGSQHNHTFIGGSFTSNLYGLHLTGTGSMSGLTFVGSNFEACGDAAPATEGGSFFADVEDLQGVSFVGCRSEGSVANPGDEWDFAFLPPAAGWHRGITVSGGYYHTANADHCFVFSGAAGGEVTGISIKGVYFEGYDLTPIRCESDGGMGGEVIGNVTDTADIINAVPPGMVVENNRRTNGTFIRGGRQAATVSADRGDADVTLTMGTSETTQRFATALTANRAVTLPVANLYTGAKFRIVRTGLGAFTLDVGGLKTIASGTAAFVDVEYDGTAWRLTGYGAL